ncbi:MAG: 30S ribosomal protein S20 [Candidatus Shapirobacteria bacterium]
MPISRSAKKSLRKSVKNKKVNVSFKEKLKKLIKIYLTKPTAEGYKEVQSMLDIAKQKNIFHINKVSRLKSKLNKKYGEGKVGVKTNTKQTAKKKTTKKVNKKTVKKAGLKKVAKK